MKESAAAGSKAAGRGATLATLLVAIVAAAGLLIGTNPAAGHGAATPGKATTAKEGPAAAPKPVPASLHDAAHAPEKAPQRAEPTYMLAMPMMNAERGRGLFAEKGCAACHSVNGIGGRVGPRLDAYTMGPVMNPFDFVAKMWSKATRMIPAQEEKLGAQVELTGDEIADIVAFAHDDAEQRKFGKESVPSRYRAMIPGFDSQPTAAGPRRHADVRLAMPMPDAGRGMRLFAAKGCVACHEVNGVGGKDAAALDAATMPPVMNPFDLAAKLWTMAPAMIPAQKEALGHQAEFTGAEFADIVAFLHDPAAQRGFMEASIPPEVREKMAHGHGEGSASETGHGHGEGSANETGHGHGAEPGHDAEPGPVAGDKH